MKFIKIATDTYVDMDRCFAILPPGPKNTKKTIKMAEADGKLYDVRLNARTQSVLCLDTGHVFVSPRPIEEILKDVQQFRE